jgi:hypothetical protein
MKGIAVAWGTRAAGLMLAGEIEEALVVPLDHRLTVHDSNFGASGEHQQASVGIPASLSGSLLDCGSRFFEPSVVRVIVAMKHLCLLRTDDPVCRQRHLRDN